MSFIKQAKHTFDGILYINPLSLPTWLALGATLQMLSLTFLPTKLSYLLPIIFLVSRVVKAFADSKGLYKTSFQTIKHGRWTGELPKDKDGDGSDGIVMFVLGARINHPLGAVAQGGAEVGAAFGKMWAEASKNREKWGYLGRTSTLHDVSDNEGMTMVWLSYWKDLKRLQEFSASPFHRVASVAWDKGKYPYVGIFHETYHASNGHWETIYGNVPAWGFGRAATKMDTLQPKMGTEHANMFQRMRRNQAIAEGVAMRDEQTHEAA